MGYLFDSSVSPRRPLDPQDPCPLGWDTVIEDARDRSAQFWGNTPPHLLPYIEWEKRELKRFAAKRAA
jgi:hypothetical protein